MLNDYIKLDNLSEQFKNLANDIRSAIPTAVFGVQFEEKCHICSSLDMPVLYIAKDSVTAKAVCNEVSAITGKQGVFLCAKGDVLLFNKEFNKESVYDRLTALYKMKKGATFVATTIESLLQLLPKKVDYFTLKKDEEYSFEQLISKLVSLGYKRKDEVEFKGDFACRGDIIKIYPINYDGVVRLDFFGDQLEDIKLSTSSEDFTLDSVDIVTTTDVLVDSCEIADIKVRLKQEVRNFGVSIFASRAKEIVSQLNEGLDGEGNLRVLSFILPLLDNSQGKITDYLPSDTVVVYDECKMINDSLNGLLKEHSERCLSLNKNGEAFSFTSKQYLDQKKLFSILNSFKYKLALQNITSLVGFFNPLKTYRINCSSVIKYHLKPEELYVDLKNWKANGYRVIICCGNLERADKLSYELEKARIYCETTNSFESDFSGVKVTSYYMSQGLIYHECKLVIIGTGDIYSKNQSEKKIKKKRNDLYTAPEIGDYCVHETHGIGIVRGMKKITTTDGTKDYVAIEYRGGDMLYVCVDRMDSLTKYLGGEEKPSLSRIGGAEFERIKERVKQSIAQLTINLKKLYSERKNKKGFVFSPDNALTEEFADSFQFDETEDQLQSIQEITADMQSEKVMDRLLCGDVGFGKTEVALRAIFKAVLDGKQVAFIAPTTILSEQHYMTCKQRFKDFGVRLGVLNRFRSQSQQEMTLYDISQGNVDVVIGTHRVFSNDVKFKDLGLLVLDEEQRFGVEHKEKLKLLKSNVDTLTMSATPIPRTLHMSLTGIRDISTINTPPTSRIPVQAFVTEQSDALIRDAIMKELSRDGQCFILFNRVEGIDEFASSVKKIVPEAKIIVGHGQMPEKTLENNILAFYRNEYNVLISTTIIENGVDLPNANTIIIIDADKIGLSTLYQLKGRVGRGDKMANAYFTYKGDKVLTETAYKRLSALMEFTDLGSGFKIAMRDLEIRGAGNVLGKEQHGHMDKIGYELYSKLLKEQLGESTAIFETELDIGVSAFIPDEYINTSALRMDCYKQIAEITNNDQERVLIASIKDNFGQIPLEVDNLIKIARLKRLCKSFTIIKVEVSKNNSKFTFKNLNSLNNEGLMNAINKFKQQTTLTFEENPLLMFKIEGANNVATLNFMLEFLNFAVNFTN